MEGRPLTQEELLGTCHLLMLGGLDTVTATLDCSIAYLARNPDHRKALVEDPAVSKFSGQVQDSGEGRWTVMAAIEEAVPADVIATSLFTRFRSRQEQSFAEKVLSAMRFQFGGHVERPTGG